LNNEKISSAKSANPPARRSRIKRFYARTRAKLRLQRYRPRRFARGEQEVRRYTAGIAILIGGLIAGTLDILYATGYSAWRGMSPQSLLQFVASGLLGQPSFEGGNATAALGLLLHYLMMLLIAAIFYALSRQLTFLVRKPFVWGPVYGFLVYWVMNLVVMQLSATPSKWRFVPLSFATGIIVHMFFIGAIIAWAASKGPAPKDLEQVPA